MKSPACGERERREDAGQGVRVLLAAQGPSSTVALEDRRVAVEVPAAAAQVGDLAAGPEARAALDRARSTGPAPTLPAPPASRRGRPLRSPASRRRDLAVAGPLALAGEQVDVGGAAGRADRELGLLGPVVGGRQDRPVAAEQLGQRQAAVDVGLGVVGDQDQRVLLEEPVEPAARLDQRREAVVGAGDRLDARLGPVAVRVVVVVGEREEQEVEGVVAWTSSAAQQAE